MNNQKNINPQELHDFLNPNRYLDIRNFLRIFIVVFLVTSVGFYIIKWNIIEQVSYYGSSMYPTIKDGEKLNFLKTNLFINKSNIVIVNRDGEEYIRRIVGLPNERVLINNQRLYITNINGENIELFEPYLNKDGNQKSLPTCAQPNCSYEYDEILLKQDEYYVLGDNRPSSYDSRVLGPIKKSEIRSVLVK